MRKKGSLKRRHVVAWINKAEWDQVREYLYSKDSALQRNALHRISAWKARYANSTPVAMDCTADLVRCQVLDRSGKLDSHDLVLLYGAALVRFTNLITERQQGKIARPLRTLAGNLNIPEWIINLRHDVTHRKMPALKLCRKGCEVVLEWLQQEYWSRQLGGGPSEDWESDAEDEEVDLKKQEEELIARQKEMEAYKNGRDLLISFEKEQYLVYGALHEDNDENSCQDPLADISWILGEIKQFSVEWTDLLIDVLLEDGFLIPTAQQLSSLGCDTSDSVYLSLIEPKLPRSFLLFWLPLLKVLNAPSFIHLFLEKLFAELKLISVEQCKHRLYYISAWISEVMLCNSTKCDYHYETKAQKKARMKDRIFSNRIQLRWQQLLSACLDAPCVSTRHLLYLILEDMEHPLPLETQQSLLQLCTIYTQEKRSELDPEQKLQPIYTLESLHEKLQRFKRHSHSSALESERSNSSSSQENKLSGADAEKAKILRGSSWQVCSDKVMWKNYPLGRVPGQSDDPSCLLVDSYTPMSVFDQPVEMESSTQHKVSGPSASTKTAEGLLWSHSDFNKLKCGLQLF
ncbi:ribosomal biogenesis protein LAS1L [Dunckerocampus dactyliophorus]|uniref:ribosomal biogenesis protein LAS1L n=1 Tax=Dunckerocampus dactyliophorus TaxID=161453 RepID=UPI002406FC09|nr:ribosomal biogenesis protein LAS1L [Dunckerocampus dactyliophorus]